MSGGGDPGLPSNLDQPKLLITGPQANQLVVRSQEFVGCLEVAAMQQQTVLHIFSNLHVGINWLAVVVCLGLSIKALK
jgi:hypothetical protein